MFIPVKTVAKTTLPVFITTVSNVVIPLNAFAEIVVILDGIVIDVIAVSANILDPKVVTELWVLILTDARDVH